MTDVEMYAEADREYDKTMKETHAANRVMRITRDHAKRSRKAFNDVWAAAPKSKLLQKAVKTEGKGTDKVKKPSTRLNKKTGKHEVVDEPYLRRIGKTPVQSLLSGAVACEVRKANDLAKKLRVHYRGEHKGSNALPLMAKGTLPLLEQCTGEWIQSLVAAARSTQMAFKETKHIAPRDVHFAAKVFASMAAASTSIAPVSVVFLQNSRRKRRGHNEAQEGAESTQPVERAIVADAAGEAGEEASPEA